MPRDGADNKIPTLVINLDSDEERLASIWPVLSGEAEFDPRRISGVAGSKLPRMARQLLALNAGWAAHSGEIGCFLSHVKAWEAIEAINAPFSIVLEDDAKLRALGRVRTLELPRDADLVFLNHRMSPGSVHDDFSVPVTCVQIDAALRRINQTKEGVGTDGYILTNQGSKKLLEAVSEDFCFGHIDWRLLRYSLKAGDLDREFAGTWVSDIVRNHHNSHRPPAWGVIKAYCVSTPLVWVSEDFASSRVLANTIEA